MTLAQPQGNFGYQNVRIIKTSSVGVGSYGAVYRALCDELPCAAKIIHPTLFQTHDPDAQKIIERFELECQFLNGVRHPQIVQYLGVTRDPESGLPVLLMELMDGSLTQFLEQSNEPLPFHIQVDICHNIALALAYLHSNDIIHRDLSSNNVLLIGPGHKAKVTDFGMSKLAEANPRMTPMTMCPGTLPYMPPEALGYPPVYTNKLDCFSFGVLNIQILTRQFPNPSPHCKIMEIDDPRFPTGQVKVPIPEVERRQSHIDQVDSTHPLLPVALDCLKDRERERPSAQELCHRLAALKDAPQYGESMQQPQRAITDGESVQIRELQAEVRERQSQLQEKDRTIASRERQLQEKDHKIASRERQLQEKDRTIASRERQLQQLNQQLEANEQTIVDFQHKHLESEKKIRDLGQTLVAKDQQIRKLQKQSYDQPTAKLQARGRSAKVGSLCLYWRKCRRAPFRICERTGSYAMDGDMVYCDQYCYDSEERMWSFFQPGDHSCFSLAVVNGYLTAIGGNLQVDFRTHSTNKLLSLTRRKKWVEHFPPMPTSRSCTAAVCSGKSLVVAGGKEYIYGNPCMLNTVEVMDTNTLQWFTASSMPFALAYASATICQDHIYLLGYETSNECDGKSVLACSMADLLKSCRSQSPGASLKKLTLQDIWHRVADLRVQFSKSVTLCGQLLAVGGYDYGNDITAIRQYNPATDSWKVISHMPTARIMYNSLVAVLPGNKLMVVGGCTRRFSTDETSIVEIATCTLKE